MIRSAVFVSVLVISVELAQPCMVLGYGAFMGCFNAPAVLQRAATTTHLTAHVPSCALGRAPIAGYKRLPHGMLLLSSDCRGSGQNRVSNKKKNGPPLKSSQTSDDFSALHIRYIDMITNRALPPGELVRRAVDLE